MQDFDSFILELYYAKQKWEAIQSGFIKPVWDVSTQNQLNSISNLVSADFYMEAHVIAAQRYFKEQAPIPIILGKF